MKDFNLKNLEMITFALLSAYREYLSGLLTIDEYHEKVIEYSLALLNLAGYKMPKER